MCGSMYHTDQGQVNIDFEFEHRKYTAALKGSQEAVIAKAIKATTKAKSQEVGDGQKMAPLASSMNDELEEAAKDLKAKQQKELDKMKLGMDLSQYKVRTFPIPLVFVSP